MTSQPQNNHCLTQNTEQEAQLLELEQEIFREQALEEFKVMLLDLLQNDREIARSVLRIVMRCPHIVIQY